MSRKLYWLNTLVVFVALSVLSLGSVQAQQCTPGQIVKMFDDQCTPTDSLISESGGDVSIFAYQPHITLRDTDGGKLVRMYGVRGTFGFQTDMGVQLDRNVLTILDVPPTIGNVGIGEELPRSRLHVNGTSWFTGDNTPLPSVAGAGVGIGYSGVGYVFAFDYGTFTPRPLILQPPTGGNVGIGTNNPTHTLSVNGNAAKPGGGVWANFSDERLKTLYGRFDAGLNEILLLQPIRYRYRQDNPLGIPDEGEHIGFTAQAVQQVIPEAVSENSQGYLMLNDEPVLWAMLNAIKELKAENDTLKHRLEALESK